MFLVTFPNNIVSLLRRWLNVLAKIIINLIGAKLLTQYTKGVINPVIAYITVSLCRRYLSCMVMAAYIFFIERKRIIKIPLYKKAYYCLMWPWFDIIGSISVLIAMFSHVEWKPIPHNANVNIEELADDIESKNN